MKNFTTTTYVEPEVGHSPKGFTVTLHVNQVRKFFHAVTHHTFQTPTQARDFMRTTIANGGRWLRYDVVPTDPYSNLPDIRAWKTHNSLTLLIDNQTVAETNDPHKLKQAIRNHPQGHFLTPKPCRRCAGLPVINLAENTLRHTCEAHQITIREPAIPIALKVATWNDFFSRRRSKLKVDSVTIPHLIALGIVREPSNRDMMRRIRKVELL